MFLFCLLFKEQTLNKTILMGRKTFDSLPRMLPNRKHIVLTSSENLPSEVEVYKELKQILESYNRLRFLNIND